MIVLPSESPRNTLLVLEIGAPSSCNPAKAAAVMRIVIGGRNQGAPVP